MTLRTNMNYAKQQWARGTAMKDTWNVATLPMAMMLPRDEAEDGRHILGGLMYLLFAVGHAPVSCFVVGGLLAGPKVAMFAANAMLGEKMMEGKVSPFIARLVGTKPTL